MATAGPNAEAETAISNLQADNASQAAAIASLQTRDNAHDQLIALALTRVAARYQAGAPQSFPSSSETRVNFEQVVTGTAGVVTTGANWVFTAPVTVHYHVQAALMYQRTTEWSPIEAGNLQLLRNGSYVSQLARETQFDSTNNALYLQGSDVVHLNGGDTLYVTQYHDAGVILDLHPPLGAITPSWIAITLIGAE